MYNSNIYYIWYYTNFIFIKLTLSINGIHMYTNLFINNKVSNLKPLIKIFLNKKKIY